MWTRDMTDQSNIEEVVSLAREIVDGADPQYETVKRFPLAVRRDIYFDGYGTGNLSLANFTMNREHIFGLNNTDLQSIIEPLFINTTLRSDGFHLPPYVMPTASIESLYSAIGDWRGIRTYLNDAKEEEYQDKDAKLLMWRTQSTSSGQLPPYCYFKKYTDNLCYIDDTDGETEVESSNRIPLLRAGEFYLILMEYLPVFEAKIYAAAFAASRGLGDTWADNFDDTNRMNILEQEYRRDFYGEGQMYFYYKRHNYAGRQVTWPSSFTFTPAAFSFPLPESYTDYVYADELPEEPETPEVPEA